MVHKIRSPLSIYVALMCFVVWFPLLDISPLAIYVPPTVVLYETDVALEILSIW